MFKQHKVTQKVNDKGIPVQKAFTFTNLEVDLDPKEIIDSDQCFLYIQSDNQIPSVMMSCENPYDELVASTNLYSTLYDHLSAISETPIPEYEYQRLVEELEVAEKCRILSNITQNINIIYKNGFDKVVNMFILEDNRNGYDMRANNPIFDLKPMAAYLNMFGVRTKELSVDSFNGGYNTEINMDPKNNDAMTNMLETSRAIMAKVVSNYDYTISRLLSENKLDIPAFARFALGEKSWEVVSESSYLSVVTGTLNQLAFQDIKKIAEIVEIAITQGTSDFYCRLNGILKVK